VGPSRLLLLIPNRGTPRYLPGPANAEARTVPGRRALGTQRTTNDEGGREGRGAGMRGRFVSHKRTCSQQRIVVARPRVAPLLFVALPDGRLRPLRELTLEELIAMAKPSA
jgi:hypothetical protein